MASRGVDIDCGPPRGVTRQQDDEECLQRCICGVWFEIHRANQRYCSTTCKDRAYNQRNPVTRQRALPFAPPAEPEPPVVDQRVPGDEELKLRGDNAAILARLRLGPATGADLERLLGPGSAWRTRVSDCRRHLRAKGETITPRRLGPRLYVYTIEAL